MKWIKWDGNKRTTLLWWNIMDVCWVQMALVFLFQRVHMQTVDSRSAYWSSSPFSSIHYWFSVHYSGWLFSLVRISVYLYTCIYMYVCVQFEFVHLLLVPLFLLSVAHNTQLCAENAGGSIYGCTVWVPGRYIASVVLHSYASRITKTLTNTFACTQWF